MPDGAGRRLYLFHLVAVRSARSMRGGGDEVQVGWVSILSRGGTAGVRLAQAAYMAALRTAR